MTHPHRHRRRRVLLPTALAVAALAGAGSTALSPAPAEAATIALHLVEANLAGHDSHGVIRVAPYLKLLREGGVVANRQARGD